MRKELKALRTEVGQLRQAVKELHRAAVAPRSARQAPVPVPVYVELGNGPVLGDSGAQVVVVEFTDFQCPFCQRFHTQTFGKLKETYVNSGKIRYLLRNFPLDFHAQAKPAAIAANCAGEQGQYWEMAHQLFTNQKRLGFELFEELATQLNLDIANFTDCLQNPEKELAVKADLAYGKSIGVRGTPNFFVGRIQNGKLVKARRISGAQPFSSFSRVLDSFLQ